jgi:hypothetical protein
MSEGDARAVTNRVIGWLVTRHHQSLGLWPWTWSDPTGERYITLYASCVAERFGDDFGALASWLDSSRWPPPDGAAHPATFFRDRLGQPDWARQAPSPEPVPGGAAHGATPDFLALVRAGASIETLAQLLEASSNLDHYLSTLAPQRHGDHAHRGPAGRQAALVMRLATEAALALDEEYAVPWTGSTGDRAVSLPGPNWSTFARRYRLRHLPFPLAPHLTFTVGDRGWLHAGGWAGDRWGNVLQFAADASGDAFDHLRTLTLRLLGAPGNA